MDYEVLRSRMVKKFLIGRGIKDYRVINAMQNVPRHLFVEEALASRAYGDYSLPIGKGQTISQPYIVAFMTEALNLTPDDSVLEIGTGSGYQTAILAKICKRVYTIERKRPLGMKARRLLSSLGYYNVILRICDGSEGWPEELYFDSIIVTASAPIVPEPLLRQLADGGRLIIPVGNEDNQKIVLFHREGQTISKKETIDCVFVKLIGNYAWKE